MHRENCNHHISTIFGCGNARPARDELLPISRGMKGVSVAVLPPLSLPFRGMKGEGRPVLPPFPFAIDLSLRRTTLLSLRTLLSPHRTLLLMFHFYFWSPEPTTLGNSWFQFCGHLSGLQGISQADSRVTQDLLREFSARYSLLCNSSSFPCNQLESPFSSHFSCHGE